MSAVRMVEETTMDIKKYTRLSFFLFALACLLVLLNSLRFYARVDISASKQFSLSKESKQILDEVDQTLTLTYYVSPQLQTLYPQVGDVHDFLLSYQNYTRHVVYRNADPTKENMEQTLVSLGVTPQQIQTSKDNQTSFLTVFSAIMIEYQGSTELIPFVLSASTLEYDLAIRLKTLLLTDKPLVQVFVANELTLFDNYDTMGNWLEAAGFFVLPITDRELAYLDLNSPLIVLGQKMITNETLPLLEEFVMKGGAALFAVSKNEATLYGDWNVTPLTKEQTKLTNLLEFWGVQVQQDLVLDVANFRITMEGKSKDAQYEYINYPFWVSLLNQNLSKDDLIVKNVQNMQLFWPSSLITFSTQDVAITPLFSSSSASWLQLPLEQGGFLTNPFEKYTFEANPRSVGSHVIGAKLEGSVDGYISTGKSVATRCIVVSDEYMFSNMLHYTGTSSNFDFLVNAVLWLSDEQQLLSIRQKQDSSGQRKDFEDAKLYNQRQRSFLAFQFILLPLLIGAIFFVVKRRS
ncbi:MAG: Gldg family protein [Treponemataceae bacterium]